MSNAASDTISREPQRVTEGEFAGWMAWDTDPFEILTGPFVFRIDEAGEVVCALRLERRHLNGLGSAHGGLLMSFADFCLFAIAREAMEKQPGVTVACNSQFLGPAREGELLEGRGRVARGGGSLVFVELKLTVGDRPVLSASGIIKRLRGKR